MPDLNPHVNQMADESMVRNLTAQIEAIWPQEELLYRRYGLAGERHRRYCPRRLSLCHEP